MTSSSSTPPPPGPHSGAASTASRDGEGPAASSEHIGLVRRYFDDNAEDWSELYVRARRVNDLVLADRSAAAVHHLQARLPEGARILDAGCGAGRTSLALLRQGFHVRCVDVSPAMLEHCRRNLEQANVPAERYRITCADLVSTDLDEGSFDGVSALGFLQYQKDEARALETLHRLLRPGGVLVLSGPNRTRLADFFGLAPAWQRLRRRLSGAPRTAPAAAPVPSGAGGGSGADPRALLHRISAHAYDFRRFRALLEGAGFEVLEERGHGFVNFAFLSRRIGFRGELFLHRSLTALSRVLPIRRWANDLIVVARRR